jgi:hypothetical protein
MAPCVHESRSAHIGSAVDTAGIGSDLVSSFAGDELARSVGTWSHQALKGIPIPPQASRSFACVREKR